ncbi:hypothetical protein V7O66_02015 [Methanolobus sp. ZRKC3]|uniref:DUF7847 domain-containing protein n=1 Tax=Methanolobus sp. ZRKC3 TaxID=3125786 RepID=UPI00324442F3
MKEDIGTVLNKGFGTWIRNLNICVPFIFEFMMTILLSVLAMFFFVILFIVPVISERNIDPEHLTPESILGIMGSVFSGNIIPMLLLGLVFLLVYMFIQSFFMAGAIGMSKEASEKGDSRVADMIFYGMKNVKNLFFTKIMVSLLVLAGVIFLLPGILSIGDLDIFLANPENAIASTSLLTFGALLWTLYIIALSIVLLFVEHVIVIEELDPVTAIEKGFSFFLSNKLHTFILWSVLIGISLLLSLIGNFLGSVELLAQLWELFNYVLTIVVIQPLVTIWWTRFYLNRTDRKLYSFRDYVLTH